MFTSINPLSENLHYLVGNDAEELMKMIKQITLPVQVVSIYSQGSRHYAWIITTAKIKKVKEKSNG